MQNILKHFSHSFPADWAAISTTKQTPPVEYEDCFHLAGLLSSLAPFAVHWSPIKPYIRLLSVCHILSVQPDGEYASEQQFVNGPGEGSALKTSQKELNLKSSRENQWTIIGLCGFCCPPFTKGTMSFQSVRSQVFQHLAHKTAQSQYISINQAANSCKWAPFSIHVVCLGSERTLLVSGSFLSGLDWHGLSELALWAGPGAFFFWHACGSEWLVSSDYWTWPEQQL